MGIIQRAIVRSCPHVWFERSEMKDRHLVTKRFVFHLLTSARFFLVFCLEVQTYYRQNKNEYVLER